MTTKELSTSVNSWYELADKNGALGSLEIELTARCNWRCVHCYIPSYTEPGFETNTLLSLISEARTLGCFELTLTGGEIMLRKDTVDLVMHARELGMRVWLLSNASRISERHAREFAELGVHMVALTLFSMDASVHDQITQRPGSHAAAMRGLTHLVKQGVPVRINCPLTRLNFSGRREVYEFVKKNKFALASTATLFPRMDGDQTPLNFGLDSEQMNECLGEIDELTGWMPPSLEDNPGNWLCPELRYSIAINALGEVHPCGSYPLTLGRVSEESLSSIWNSPYAQEVRSRKQSVRTACRGCEVASACSYCPALSFSFNGASDFGCTSSIQAQAITRHERILPLAVRRHD